MTKGTPRGRAGGAVGGDTGRLPHVPALDGLRGMAVAGVLCFHGGFGWASGGFLGVSTFFTLSGFLITSLLVLEHRSTGRIDLRAFWVRRCRRLMPAAYVGIAMALAYGLVAADTGVREDLAGDAAASVGQVANWWFLASGRSYADLFAGPSPLLHFWSLAVEEQFYLAFPLVAWLAVDRRGWRVERFAAVLGGAALLALATPLVVELSDDAVYYGTWTRMPELVLGALLATFAHRPRRTGGNARTHAAVATAGAVGLTATVATWALAERGDAWLYRGGLALYALGTCAVVAAALLADGPVVRLLSLAPLRHLGVVSYGIYVFHWPIFLCLDERRVGVDGALLFALRCLVTLIVAEVSFQLLEHPVRRDARMLALRPSTVALPTAATLVVLALVLSSTTPAPPVDFAAAAEDLARGEHEVATRSTAPAVPAGALDPLLVAEEAPPPRVAFYGDSTAMMVAFGFGAHLGAERAAGRDPGITTVSGAARMGCGIGRGGERRTSSGEARPVKAVCDNWAATWAEKVRVFSPTVAVVLSGPWDVMDRRLPGDDVWRGPGDPVYDTWLYAEMLEAVDVAASNGAGVVWLTTPGVNERVDPRGDWGAPGVRGPERWRALNDLIRRLEVDRPERVRVVDLAAWVEEAGRRDLELRPDGVHYAEEGGRILAEEFLAEAIRSVNDELWVAGRQRRVALATARAAHPPVTAPPVGSPLRVLVWGDPDAAAVGAALAGPAVPAGRLEVLTISDGDCGVTRPLGRRFGTVERAPPARCSSRDQVLDAARALRPHVVLVVPGAHEQAELRIAEGDEDFHPPDTTDFDDWVRAEYGQAADELRASGAAVVFALPASVAPPPGARARFGDYAPALGRVLEDLAASRARQGHVGTVDLTPWFAGLPGGTFDATVRPDGVHLGPDGARRLAAWLEPRLRAEVERLAASTAAPSGLAHLDGDHQGLGG